MFSVKIDSFYHYIHKCAKDSKEAHGVEPWTYRTAADCSTTELYPQLDDTGV